MWATSASLGGEVFKTGALVVMFATVAEEGGGNRAAMCEPDDKTKGSPPSCCWDNQKAKSP